MKKCPKCGGEEFFVNAHVVQNWTVDKEGTFVSSNNNCVEVAHYPDDEDIWECTKCAFSTSGSQFNYEPKPDTTTFVAVCPECGHSEWTKNNSGFFTCLHCNNNYFTEDMILKDEKDLEK